MRVVSAVLTALVIILSACARRDISVGGHLVASESDSIYLEKVLPGATVPVDAALIDAKGRFGFRIKDADATPTIYFLRSGGNYAALLLERGEKARIKATGSFSVGYTVEGSPGSARMLELREIMTSGMARLDSITAAFSAAPASGKQAVWDSYAGQYYATKRQQLDFITARPASIASLYALYQRMPNTTVLADGKSDVIFYRMVADSTGVEYPDSPYVKALQKNLQDYEQRADMAELLNKSLSGEPVDYPEIEMPDIYGVKHKLSDLHGKVVILDFWSVRTTGSPINNAEMKKLYERYSGMGLEIYQVNLDETRQAWVSAVTTQKLPWIGVGDQRGAASPYAMRYNVQALPANFVIDREGNIAGRDLFGEYLEKCIEKLI